ncbi:MAG: glycosyltransferase [Bacteroidota bacterium]
MKKIGHLLLLDALGGVERWYLDLAQAGFFERWEHIIFACAKELDTDLVERFSLWVDIVHLGHLSVFSKIRSIQLAKVTHIHNHIYLHAARVLPLFWLTSNPNIITHNHSAALNHIHARLLSVLAPIMKKFIQLLSHKYVAVSRKSAMDLFPTDAKVTLLACVLAHYEQIEAKTIPTDKIRLLHVGRFYQSSYFEDAKNQSFILPILDALEQQSIDFVMHFVGGGDHYSIKAHIEAAGLRRKVFFNAFQNVDEAYRASNILLVPSQHEGYGLVALEAQLYGLHTLISDAVPHEVIHKPLLVKQLPIRAHDAKVWVDCILNLNFPPPNEEIDRNKLNFNRHLEAIYKLYD